jgi:DNA-binding NarL/FixJ family response regulator
MSEEYPRSLAVQRADVRVLLADDEEMSRRGFSAALDESCGITVVGCTRVDAGVNSSVVSCRPHVVLLNAATDSDWAGTVRGVLANPPQPDTPKVIVVTGADIEDHLFQAVQAGAAGVLLRSMSVEELSYAVRHVAIGHSVVSPAATSWIFARLRMLDGRESHSIASIAAINVLSRRERQILAGLASGKSNHEIAVETHLAVATVKSHVSNVLTKLDLRDRVQAALLGQSAGIGSEFQPAPASSAGQLEDSRGNPGHRYPVRVEQTRAV